MALHFSVSSKKNRPHTGCRRFSWFLRFSSNQNGLEFMERKAQHSPGERTHLDESILALASSFRLLLTLDGRLLVVLSLANFSDDAVLRTRTLETLERSIQGLVLSNTYFCHEFFPPFVQRQRLSIISRSPKQTAHYKHLKWYEYIVSHSDKFVKAFF